MEKVRKRIKNWKNKCLSFAGRLQLVTSVLSSMHGYWASVFILPVSIILDIEKLMQGFLWCQGEMKAGKSKVAWEDICFPKHEGGLGIKRLSEWNVALITSMIWRIITRKESLWVRWVHAHKICDRNFWDIPTDSDMSWGQRKIMEIRDIIQPHCWYRVGNGHQVSVWFDTWCPNALSILPSQWTITRAGFHFTDSIADILDDHGWR